MGQTPPVSGWLPRLGLILVSGLLYGSAFPPLEFRALAWICLVPLFLGLRSAGPLAVIFLAWTWLLAASYSSGHWLPDAVEVYYRQGPWVGWLFFFVIASLNAAPYYLPMALALGRLNTRWSKRGFHPWIVASVWVGAELMRGRLLTDIGVFLSNPWAQIGYSQADLPVLIQIASLTGIYGVTFAIVAFNAALAEAVVRWRAGPSARSMRGWLMLFVSGLAPALIIVTFGVLRLAASPPAGDIPSNKKVSIAIIQAHVPTSNLWDPNLYASNFEIYLRLSAKAIAASNPGILIWPESAMAFFIEDEPNYRRSLASLLARQGTTLLAGGVRRETYTGEDLYFNTIFAINPDGRVTDHYDKVKLVPFGEYFPLRSVEFLRRRFERVRVFEPAKEAKLLATPIGPAATATCNESMLPEVVSRRIALGGEWILNPSNDSWSPVPVFADQMLDMAILRAVEQHRWLVRASTTGPSAIVDPLGRVIESSRLGERDWVSGEIASETERTPYSRFGEVFALVCFGCALVLWCCTFRRAI